MVSIQTRDGSADPAVITLYEDGPYLVRGNFEVRDQHGRVINSRRRTIALCRCGRSKLRPFCDGAHRTTSFRAAGTREALPASAAVDSMPTEQAPSVDSMPNEQAASVVTSDPEQTLAAVAVAHLTVLNSLAEDQQNALLRAEPLLRAAKALLQWQLDAPDLPLDVPSTDGHGLAAARAALGAALKSAIRLRLHDSATADQVRSLLRDAASGLRPDQSSTLRSDR